MVLSPNSSAARRYDNRARPVAELVIGGLTTLDDRGVRQPQLAEAVPSIDNGLWQVLPDGRMQTTHRLRERVTWHDGAPLTSDDLVFTATVAMRRSVPPSVEPGLKPIQPNTRTSVPITT